MLYSVCVRSYFALQLLTEESRKTGNKNNLQKPMRNKALILNERNDLEGAMKLQKEQERICKKLEKYRLWRKHLSLPSITNIRNLQKK
jgi:hypothetical protein